MSETNATPDLLEDWFLDNWDRLRPVVEAEAEQARILEQLARQADAYRRRHPDEVA